MPFTDMESGTSKPPVRRSSTRTPSSESGYSTLTLNGTEELMQQHKKNGYRRNSLQANGAAERKGSRCSSTRMSVDSGHEDQSPGQEDLMEQKQNVVNPDHSLVDTNGAAETMETRCPSPRMSAVSGHEEQLSAIKECPELQREEDGNAIVQNEDISIDRTDQCISPGSTKNLSPLKSEKFEVTAGGGLFELPNLELSILFTQHAVQEPTMIETSKLEYSYDTIQPINTKDTYTPVGPLIQLMPHDSNFNSEVTVQYRLTSEVGDSAGVRLLYKKMESDGSCKWFAIPDDTNAECLDDALQDIQWLILDGTAFITMQHFCWLSMAACWSSEDPTADDHAFDNAAYDATNDDDDDNGNVENGRNGADPLQRGNVDSLQNRQLPGYSRMRAYMCALLYVDPSFDTKIKFTFTIKLSSDGDAQLDASCDVADQTAWKQKWSEPVARVKIHCLDELNLNIKPQTGSFHMCNEEERQKSMVLTDDGWQNESFSVESTVGLLPLDERFQLEIFLESREAKSSCCVMKKYTTHKFGSLKWSMEGSEMDKYQTEHKVRKRNTYIIQQIFSTSGDEDSDDTGLYDNVAYSYPVFAITDNQESRKAPPSHFFLVLHSFLEPILLRLQNCGKLAEVAKQIGVRRSHKMDHRSLNTCLQLTKNIYLFEQLYHVLHDIEELDANDVEDVKWIIEMEKLHRKLDAVAPLLKMEEMIEKMFTGKLINPHMKQNIQAKADETDQAKYLLEKVILKLDKKHFETWKGYLGEMDQPHVVQMFSILPQTTLFDVPL